MNLNWLTCLLLVCLCSTLGARTYHVDPARGSASGDGSKSSPWRTLEEVVSGGSLRILAGGDTVLLADGDHGRVDFSGDNTDFVTIAADAGCKPKVSYFEIKKGSKWRIKGLTISSSFADKPYPDFMLKVADGGESSDIIIEDCFVYAALDSSKWTAQQWIGANSGMFMGRHGKGHVFRNNYVFNTRFGIALCAEDGLCEGNVISHFSADGIRVTRDGQVVQHNVIRNIYVDDKDGDANHDDAIQCFLFNKGTGTVRNVTIRENLIVMRQDEEQKWQATMQGIGFFDGPLVKFTVEGNVINTSHWHGVSLYDAQDCAILNNVAYTQWEDSKLRPWVELGTKKAGPVKGNTVKGNFAYTFKLTNDPEVVAQDNQVVTKEIHTQREQELLTLINKKFGPVHVAASFSRLGLERTQWLEGAVVTDSAGEKAINLIQENIGKGKLIVLYVYSHDRAKDKRCVLACEQFERETLEDAGVCEQLYPCIAVRIAAGDQLTKELKKRYVLGSRVPCIYLFDAQGKKIWESPTPSAKMLAKQLKDSREEIEKKAARPDDGKKD